MNVQCTLYIVTNYLQFCSCFEVFYYYLLDNIILQFKNTFLFLLRSKSHLWQYQNCVTKSATKKQTGIKISSRQRPKLCAYVCEWQGHRRRKGGWECHVAVWQKLYGQTC